MDQIKSKLSNLDMKLKIAIPILCFIIIASAALIYKSLGTDYEPADIEIFVADFCGYCKKIKPEIARLIAAAPAKKLKVKVYVMEEDPEMMDIREISSFPTIIIHGNMYTGERTSESILAAADTPEI